MFHSNTEQEKRLFSREWKSACNSGNYCTKMYLYVSPGRFIYVTDRRSGFGAYSQVREQNTRTVYRKINGVIHEFTFIIECSNDFGLYYRLSHLERETIPENKATEDEIDEYLIEKLKREKEGHYEMKVKT